MIKWLFPDRPEESDAFHALQILRLFKNSRLPVIQPPHWLEEVAAVTTRLEPKRTRAAVSLLFSLEFQISSGMDLYLKVCDLSDSLTQHLFDTLCHAVALTGPDTILITADDRYYRKAASAGHIERLKDFTLPSGSKSS
ncbi:MAG: PIN domain-containing protein [Nitrospirae bacterium]|nr:PIN domain-containing protein [Nitrospirota bacterium]